MNFIRVLIVLAFGDVAAQAHFSFITPLPGGTKAELFLSETLRPDPAVNVALLKDAQLKVRDAAGKETSLELVPDTHRFSLELPGNGSRTIYGFADLGLSAAWPAKKPYVLLYYPKAIYGSPFAVKPLGDAAVAELAPEGVAGKTSILFLVKGKPRPDSEITVILPDGTQKQVKTDARGRTPEFAQIGRYGAWARYWDPAQGSRNGKPYEELRHYATLVFDALPEADRVAKLPEASASLGAVADGGFLYVYGGHIVRTHNYSTAAVSGRFHRMNLATRQWEELPGGPALQGMNLAAHNGEIYRAGGMQPRNKPGEKQLNYSVASVARFNPASRRWEDLPPLPEPRSSHDVAVIDGKLYVTSGWEMRGEAESAWSTKTFVMDLASPTAGWKEVAQPFQRRALITAVHQNRMYVIGGIQPNNQVSLDVDIYDPVTNSWSKGPALPGPAINGFATAAADYNGTLHVSLGNGTLLRLDEQAHGWLEAGTSTPRLAHRMISAADTLLVVGGAHAGNNSDLVEAFLRTP